MPTDLSSFNNHWYKPGASRLKQALWFLVNAVFLSAGWQPFSGLRRFFLRLFGAKLEKGLVFKPGISVKYPWRLSIGNHSWIGENVWIDNLDDVSIGNNVCISQGALLLTGNHDYKKATFDLMTGPIVLEDGCWIGAKSIVCPGVRVGTHAVLTVGSVATSDLKPYTIYQGNPAKAVKERILEQ
jgi:putative colanic acid biosynthesis acetyltransferase WcaF